ncbi:hypothetical protein [Chitinophaga agri]|uniref:Uncharacterized protein n=1 Tax=Chitinophaga agri TaxID=2703787 RepID=A0A6B9ZP57_9BACT|nr:hypothetical protein [Chitinophaga agri]QHS63716.1 hypothetical protein GWR21_30285 [Chitinophaga agri]
MGLDLYHYTLTEKYEPAYNAFYYLEDLEVFPEIIHRNEHLINTIIEPATYFEIIIFDTEQQLQLYQESNDVPEHKVALIYKTFMLNTDISKIEKRYSLDPDDTYTFSTQRKFEHPGMLTTANFSYTAISYAMTYEKRKIIYYKEIGYQRKGVKGSFYDDFRNDGSYFSRKDVIRLFGHLDDSNNEDYKWRAENFQQNFLDNFVEGHSILHISW